MPNSSIEDEVFDKQDFTTNRLPKGDYEYCTFLNSNFSEGLLSETRFLECEFIDYNVSSANITNTAFQDVKFKDCKLLGLHFENGNPFGFSIQVNNRQLNHDSFYQVVLKQAKLMDSKLQNVDFAETNLSDASFDNSDLQGATFENAILNNTDFCKAINYTIHPEQNRMKGAKFSFEGVDGLLSRYSIEIEK